MVIIQYIVHYYYINIVIETAGEDVVIVTSENIHHRRMCNGITSKK